MEKQISIIIPTYNMEKYIGKCLDSLLIPELDQVEVLVVNDGSKDRSSKIAHSYADRYPGSIRVIDKPNGNYGSCINAALPLCTGRYVKVLDADDTFNTDAFSKFVQLISLHDEDMILTDMVVVGEDRIIRDNTIRSNIQIDENRAYLFEEIAVDVLENLGMHSFCYKRTIFSDICYKQSEGVSYSDNEWVILPTVNCNSISYLNVGYLYLLGREGQTMDPDIYAKKIGDMFLIYHNMLHFYDIHESCLSQIHRTYLEGKIINNMYYTYTRIINLRNPVIMTKLKSFDDELKDINPHIYNQIGEISYNQYTTFRPIKSLRDRNFPSKFSYPIGLKFQSVIGKLLSIIRR